MVLKRLSLLMCLVMVLSLGGCTLPEDQRFINPTEAIDWEPTEPPTTEPKAAEEPRETKATTPPSAKTAEQIASELSEPDLIAQLFLVKCPAGGASELLDLHHVGGIVLYGQDTAGETPQTLKAEIRDYQSRVPVKLIIAVDEEGAPVNRVSNREAFREEEFPSVRSAYDDDGTRGVRAQEAEKSRFLRNLGINVNLSPVCDVVTDDHAFMADRSMRLTEIATAEVVTAMVEVMHENGVGAVLKHFPGYGNLTGDTHTGKVVDERSMASLRTYDFKPFQAGIRAGADAVMIGHSIVNAIDSSVPAVISDKVVNVLRDELKFKGVIITDDITMGAITEYYDVGEASVRAIIAGCDMILTGWSEEQYNAVYQAVYEEGRISEERLMESVVRIIQWKMDLGLL